MAGQNGDAQVAGIINEVEAPLQEGMSEATLTRFKARKLLLEPGYRGQSSVHREAETRYKAARETLEEAGARVEILDLYSMISLPDINQVYLHQPTSNRIDIYNLGNGQRVGEIAHNAGEYFASLAWVQPGQVAGLCKTSGKVMVMDYLSSPRVLVTGRIDPFKVAAYDSTFKLFFSIGTDHKTRVYCGELWPNGLSAPVFEPATVYGLKGNRVRVRLTGQDGEPMPGWWVNWELEGVGGEIIGSLDKYGNLTDADGYASNLYIGPDDGSTGQCKIKARVVL